MAPANTTPWSKLHKAVVSFDNEKTDRHLQKIDVLLRLTSPVDSRTSTGGTPLHLACASNSIDLVKLLISRGAPVSAVNNQYETPLHHSVMRGNLMIIEYLLKQKDIDIDAEDITGCTPLHWAMQQNERNIYVIQALLDAGAFVDAVDDEGNTPLHYAATDGNVEALDLLLAANANASITNRDGLTALHSACAVDQGEVVERMMQHGGAAFKATLPSRVHELTPLHLATKVRGSSTIEVLLAAYAGDVDVRDAYDRTPLHLAAKMGNSVAATALLKRGASRSVRDTFGRRPAWYAKTPMPEFS